MKKIGLIVAAVSATLFLALFLVQQTGWYDRQQVKTMSEFGELVDAAFWASMIAMVLGLLVFAAGCRPKAAQREEQEQETPVPLTKTWFCGFCGNENSEGFTQCLACARPRILIPTSWKCVYCSQENPLDVDVCQACGTSRYRRPRVWVCPWCGSVSKDNITTCPACGYKRFINDGEDLS